MCLLWSGHNQLEALCIALCISNCAANKRVQKFKKSSKLQQRLLNFERKHQWKKD